MRIAKYRDAAWRSAMKSMRQEMAGQAQVVFIAEELVSADDNHRMPPIVLELRTATNTATHDQEMHLQDAYLHVLDGSVKLQHHVIDDSDDPNEEATSTIVRTTSSIKLPLQEPLSLTLAAEASSALWAFELRGGVFLTIV